MQRAVTKGEPRAHRGGLGSDYFCAVENARRVGAARAALPQQMESYLFGAFELLPLGYGAVVACELPLCNESQNCSYPRIGVITGCVANLRFWGNPKRWCGPVRVSEWPLSVIYAPCLPRPTSPGHATPRLAVPRLACLTKPCRALPCLACLTPPYPALPRQASPCLP